MSTRIPIPDELVAKLNARLPAEAIKQHPTKKYLSTIKTIFTIERLNEVFGLNGWVDRYEVVTVTASKTWMDEHGEEHESNPMVVVKGELTIPEYGIRREAFGGNDNEDLGDAYKGACTDALSKMASAIGIGMDVYKGNPNAPAEKYKQQPKAAPQPTPASSLPMIAPFAYRNGVMSCTILDAKHFPAKDGRKEQCVVLTNAPVPMSNKMSCFHASLFPCLSSLKKGDYVIFAVKKNGQYLNIEDVKHIGEQEYKKGIPVTTPATEQARSPDDEKGPF